MKPRGGRQSRMRSMPGLPSLAQKRHETKRRVSVTYVQYAWSPITRAEKARNQEEGRWGKLCSWLSHAPLYRLYTLNIPVITHYDGDLVIAVGYGVTPVSSTTTVFKMRRVI